jgi:hypothetical protein
MGAVRFSLGRATTATEIDEVMGRTAELPVVTSRALPKFESYMRPLKQLHFWPERRKLQRSGFMESVV